MSGTAYGVKVARRPVRAFSIDLTDSPDLFPVLTALATFGNKPSQMKGLHRLQHKESSRGVILQKELAKCGIDMALDTERDEVVVHPCQRENLKPARIDAHGDHRIAMAAALIGIAGAPIEIQGAECVAKSYPAFFDDLEHLGGQIDWVSKNRS
jgi:3-phosphoshikimate 1-carboxyvinyltransferase